MIPVIRVGELGSHLEDIRQQHRLDPVPIWPLAARLRQLRHRQRRRRLRPRGTGATVERPAWAGTSFGPGRQDSSPQTALDAPIDWRTAVSTRGTALGAWAQLAEEVIGERWRDLDLDPHAKAVGIAGDVSVRYRVRLRFGMAVARVIDHTNRRHLATPSVD